MKNKYVTILLFINFLSMSSIANADSLQHATHAITMIAYKLNQSAANGELIKNYKSVNVKTLQTFKGVSSILNSKKEPLECYAIIGLNDQNEPQEVELYSNSQLKAGGVVGRLASGIIGLIYASSSTFRSKRQEDKNFMRNFITLGSTLAFTNIDNHSQVEEEQDNEVSIVADRSFKKTMNTSKLINSIQFLQNGKNFASAKLQTKLKYSENGTIDEVKMTQKIGAGIKLNAISELTCRDLQQINNLTQEELTIIQEDSLESNYTE